MARLCASINCGSFLNLLADFIRTARATVNGNYTCDKERGMYMLRKLLLIIGCTGIFLVAGCATDSSSGRRFDDSKISLIKNGKSTKEDVLSLIGSPYTKGTTTDGTVLWIYWEINTAMGLVPLVGKNTTDEKNLEVSFNKSGVVTSCVYRKKSRTTPSGMIGLLTAGAADAGIDPEVNCENFK